MSSASSVSVKKRGLEKEIENQKSEVLVKRIKTEKYPWDYIRFALQLMTNINIIPVQDIILEYLKPHVIQWTVLRQLNRENVDTITRLSDSIFIIGSRNYLESINIGDSISPIKCIVGSRDEKIVPAAPNVPVCPKGITRSNGIRILYPSFIGKHGHHLYIASNYIIYRLNEKDGQIIRVIGAETCGVRGIPNHNHEHWIEGLNSVIFNCILVAGITDCGNYIYVLDTGLDDEDVESIDLFLIFETKTFKRVMNSKWSSRGNSQKYQDLCKVTCITNDRREPKQSDYLYFIYQNGCLRRFNIHNPGDMESRYTTTTYTYGGGAHTEKPLTLEEQPISNEEKSIYMMRCISGTGILILYSSLLNQLITVDPYTRKCETLWKDSWRFHDFDIDDRKRCLYLIDSSQSTLESMTLCPLLFPPPF